MIAEPEKYIEALLSIRDAGKLRNTQFLAMLKAQYSKPYHTITATQLADEVGYKNFNAANLQYGSLGHEVAIHLAYKPPTRKNGEPIWFWCLSDGNDASTETIEGQYEFVMRPELASALEKMKWVK